MGRPNHQFDARMARRGMTPAKFSRARMELEQKSAMIDIAMDTFTAVSNAGVPFHEAILSVYLTGLENGMMAAQEVK